MHIGTSGGISLFAVRGAAALECGGLPPLSLPFAVQSPHPFAPRLRLRGCFTTLSPGGRGKGEGDEGLDSGRSPSPHGQDGSAGGVAKGATFVVYIVNPKDCNGNQLNPIATLFTVRHP